jgi:hypothetical protein
MIKNPTREFKNFLEWTIPNNFIPSFSLFTILEIRKNHEIYSKFLELFSVLPCVILKSHEQLFADEISHYPDSTAINPILIASTGVLAPKDGKLKDILDAVFRDPKNLKNEAVWNAGRSEVVESMKNHVKNFPPENGKYSAKQIRSFIEIVGFSQVAIRAPKFAKLQVDSGNVVSIDAFPSLKMTIYTAFYKFYVDARQSKTSDTFDIIISADIPYVDAVISENHQVEVMKKIKTQDNFIKHVQGFTLRYLRP